MNRCIERITDYLSKGGFFNPEQMEHDKVRTLLIDCRDELLASRAATLREAAAKLKKCAVCVAAEPVDATITLTFYAAQQIVSNLIDPAAQSALDRERAEARLEGLISEHVSYCTECGVAWLDVGREKTCPRIKELERQLAALRQATGEPKP